MPLVPPQAASMGAVPFVVHRVTDQTGRDLVVHRFAGAAGVELEDTGAKAGEYTIEGQVLGADWLRRLRALKRVAEDDPAPSLTTFRHPYLGLLRGRVTSLVVQHTSAEYDTARFTLQFVVGVYKLTPLDASATLPSAAAAAESAATALATAASALAS